MSKSNKNHTEKKLLEHIVHTELDDKFFELFKVDFKAFMSSRNLAVTDKQMHILGVQSCYGHAVNGDLAFRVNSDKIEVHSYVNATIRDGYKAVDGNPKDAMLYRKHQIDEFKAYLRRVVNSEFKGKQTDIARLVNNKGKPLFGIRMFRDTMLANPKAVLTGAYMGAYLDSPRYREKTEQAYDIRLHKGECVAADLEKLRKYNLSIVDLARRDDGESIDGYYRNGLLIDKNAVDHTDIQIPAFFEISKGVGVSDDAAFLYLSLQYGIEAGLGFLCIDAVDTLDKCIPVIHRRGEDEIIGDVINDMVGGVENLEICEDDVLKFIYAASIDPNNHKAWASCSQRYFFEQNIKGMYAILSHIQWINHVKKEGPFPVSMKLGFEKIPSQRFYPEFLGRYKEMVGNGLIADMTVSR